MNINAIQTIIDSRKGLCVEIGGPTPGGYIFLQKLGLTLPKNILVTNISNPVVLNPFSDNPQKYNVDAVVDINKLPYVKGSVDILLTSTLPHKLHEVLFKESAKILQSDGLLIIENERLKDNNSALRAGFKPLLDEVTAKKLYSQIYQLGG